MTSIPPLAQMFKSKIKLKNTSQDSYYSLFQNASLSADATVTVPNFASQTLASIDNAQTWSAAQTFPASGVIITGTKNTILTGSATSSDKTITFPNATDTVAVLGLAQTFSADQTFSAQILAKDGTKTSPSYSFSSDTDTGIFWRSTGAVGFSSNDTDIGGWASGGAFTLGPSTGYTGLTQSFYGAILANVLASGTTGGLATLCEFIDNRSSGISFRYKSNSAAARGYLDFYNLSGSFNGIDIQVYGSSTIMSLTSDGDITLCPTDNSRLLDIRCPVGTAGSNAATMINLPGSVDGTQDGWLEIKIQGTSRYIPYWNK